MPKGSPNIFFTADTHFGHGRIIQYCNRPFADAEEQDYQIIDRLNSVLRPGDVLYHLGDVGWSSFPVRAQFLDRLRTKEVHLILGNHDKLNKMKEYPFRSISEIKSITIDGQQVVLCHYAMRSWRNKGHGAFQLYGHSHGKMPGLGRQMDVGVDTNNFFPYEWSEVRKRLDAIEYSPKEEIDANNTN